jgi:hypothetical protein
MSTDTVNGSTVALDVLNVPTTILPTQPDTTTHKLAIDAIVGEDITMPLGLDLGQEADLAIRVKVTAVERRANYVDDTRHVVTTRVKLLALNAVDDEPAPPAALPESTTTTVTVERVPAWALWAMASGLMAWILLALQYIPG